MKSVELFTGAGGLAMGCAMAGFHHQALVEWDKHSCHTIRENKRRGNRLISDWCIHQINVADFDYSTFVLASMLLVKEGDCKCDSEALLLWCRSLWDEIHPGRLFAEQLPPNPATIASLQPQVTQHCQNMCARLGCPSESAD